jgi:O-antigen/teichoic acid export membrane protein
MRRSPMQSLMENAPQSIVDEAPRVAHPATEKVRQANRWLQSPFAAILTASRLKLVACSFADQGLAVGGIFLVNVVLARTQTKEEYGMFALSYSVFTFFAGLHNAAILEPYTVYGSGRYRDRFFEYLRLMARSNAIIGLLLSGILFLTCLLFLWIKPQFVSRALFGLGLTAGILLSGTFLRRVFYVQRQAPLAARTSLVFFITVACGLWLTARTHILDSFSVFPILALGWIAGGTVFGRRLALGKHGQPFLKLEPRYWQEHWKYARWVLATAFVFQLTTQGYYWLVAGFLSVKEVAELKAMYLIVTPVDQIFIALSYLVLPVLASHYAARRMEDLLSLWKRYGLAAVGVTVFFALVVRTVGKPTMHLLYAGKFDDLAPLLFVLAFLPLIMGVGSTMNDALKAIERPKFVFLAYVCSGIVTFLAGIPLVIHFGLPGAVYGMLLSGAAYTGALAVSFFLIVYRKAHRVGLP